MQENRLNGIKISKLDRVKRNTQRYKKFKKKFFLDRIFFLKFISLKLEFKIISLNLEIFTGGDGMQTKQNEMDRIRI